MSTLLMFDQPLMVISGMQTGVDQAGLYAAEHVGIKTGGIAPKGWRTQDGNRPDLGERFGVTEDLYREYPHRTELNVMNADMTVQIAFDFQSGGEILTSRYVNLHKKGSYRILVMSARDDWPADKWVIANKLAISNLAVEAFADSLVLNNIRTLNVAGNSEKTAPGIQDLACIFLTEVFKLWKKRTSS